MKLVRFLLFLCLLIFSRLLAAAKLRVIESRELVDHINSDPHSTWKLCERCLIQADTYGTKTFVPARFARSRLGCKLRSSRTKSSQNGDVQQTDSRRSQSTKQLPENFSWTDPKITKCPIGHIRDQANCGSCWAVSTVTAFGDRICIQSKGNIMVNISAQYVTSCNQENEGCDGGYMDRVHEFLKSGVITGGDFDSDEGCQPYAVRPCSYTHKSGEKMQCTYDTAMTPKCRQRRCSNDWYHSETETEENTFKADSWKLIDADRYGSREYNIRKDLYENGPLTAAFYVFYDFIFYKSGIYQPRRNQTLLGGHAVRLVGWGVENGTKYWLLANSWSKQWGENGFFRIVRGENAAEIESKMISAMPHLNNSKNK